MASDNRAGGKVFQSGLQMTQEGSRETKSEFSTNSAQGTQNEEQPAAFADDARTIPPKGADIARQLRSQTDLPPEAVRILNSLCGAAKRTPEVTRAAAMRLAEVLAPPAEPKSAVHRGGLAPWQKRRIDEYLKNRLHRSVPVDEMAAQVQLSASHFHRAFKETFGDTPHLYLIRLKLQLARELMLTTEDPLTQIALASGFAAQSHLCKAFRRWLGETPSTWRRRNFKDAQVCSETSHTQSGNGKAGRLAQVGGNSQHSETSAPAASTIGLRRR